MPVRLVGMVYAVYRCGCIYSKQPKLCGIRSRVDREDDLKGFLQGPVRTYQLRDEQALDSCCQ